MGAKAMSFAVLQGAWLFLTTVVGIWLGILFLLLLDKAVPHLHLGSPLDYSGTAVSIEFCSGSHDLCGCGGIDTRDVSGEAFQSVYGLL